MYATNHHYYRYGQSHQQHLGRGKLVVSSGGGDDHLGLANGSGRNGARRPFSFLCIASTLSVSLAFFCYTYYYYAALNPSAGITESGVVKPPGGQKLGAYEPPTESFEPDVPVKRFLDGDSALRWRQGPAAGQHSPAIGSSEAGIGRNRYDGERSRYILPYALHINTAILRPLHPEPSQQPRVPEEGRAVSLPAAAADLEFVGGDPKATHDDELNTATLGDPAAEGRVLENDSGPRSTDSSIVDHAFRGFELASGKPHSSQDTEDPLLLAPEALEILHPRTRELAEHVHALSDALVTLKRDAEIAHRNDTVYSVTLKPQVAPSADVHDYLSLARYFWPNPDTPDGLPYVKRDGEPNPEMETVHDYRMLRAVLKDVNTLGVAYFYFRDERYALKAMDRIRTWFLDPKTRMNPNLNFASLTKGSKMGRRMGVLDMYPAYRMFNVLPFLSASPNWDPAIMTGLQEWYEEYYTWLTTSRLGILEQNGHNNHGTFWDVQALGIVVFLGKWEDAVRIANRARSKRFESQIRADGLQWAETERPTSWFYSLLNLQALMLIASFADLVGVDLWHHVNATTGEGSIKAAIDYLVPHALDGGQNWPFRNVGEFDTRDFVRELELAYIVYHEPTYLHAIDVLRKRDAAQGKVDKSQYLCQLGMLTRGNLWIC